MMRQNFLTFLVLACSQAAAQSPATSLSSVLTSELEKVKLFSVNQNFRLPRQVQGVRDLSGIDAPWTSQLPLKSTPSAASRSVNGFFVRFSDPAIHKLAEGNLPPPDAWIVAIQQAVSQPILFDRAIAGGMHLFRFARLVSADVAQEIVDAIKTLEGVEAAVVDMPVHHQQRGPADPYASYQWNLLGSAEGFPGGIAANLIWPITYGNSFPVIAIVDTGVLPHPEFGARLLPGYDFIADVTRSNDGSGIDADATDSGNWSLAGECGVGSSAVNNSWHGTHVAGIAAADGLNGYGIAGVTWQARILPVRVLGKCGGSVSDIINGIHWAAGLKVPGVAVNPNPAHIINLSLGGYAPQGCDWGTQNAINHALGQGALIVVAAGNRSDDAVRYTPASCNGVLTVAATDHNGGRASYSNVSFTAAGISAPGGDVSRYGAGAGIWSTIGVGTRAATGYSHDEYEGTSMAAPHVSGVAALGAV